MIVPTQDIIKKYKRLSTIFSIMMFVASAYVMGVVVLLKPLYTITSITMLCIGILVVMVCAILGSQYGQTSSQKEQERQYWVLASKKDLFDQVYMTTIDEFLETLRDSGVINTYEYAKFKRIAHMNQG
jgi:magnesium-transporting ATPase (P-type)